jgi:hypothetical protein
MTLSRSFGLACLGMLLAAPTWAQEQPSKETCPHAKGWRPTDEELQKILSDHRQWVAKRLPSVGGAPPALAEGRANLCNADLSFADLHGTVLTEARLNNANLFTANLSEARLERAELNNASLFSTDLRHAHLEQAKLHNANLFLAKLNNATLIRAELNDANIYKTNLAGAELDETSLAGAALAFSNLSDAIYAPASLPPNFVAGITGLRTVRFPRDRADGLAQLRELLQKSGLRDLEREATFAIENGKTKYAMDEWRTNRAGAAEGVFRLVAFDWTTRYGLHPARALLVIVAFWALLIPVYAWSIWHRPRPSASPSGIYRTWPKDRVEVREGHPTLDNPARVERLHGRRPAILGWAAYFSLLSAFQIGFREFSVGTWLARAQPLNFVLEPTGWVRTVSGLQSLLSVYLLAIWALTYFGRPFQ